MAAEKRDMSGVLFKSRDKKSDKHPDYRGDITVGGQTFWLSAWIKESNKDGSKYMSLAVQAQDEEHKGRKPEGVAGLDEDVPF